MLFKAPWLLIYLTTARWCLEIACPCTHKPHKGSGFIARKPPIFSFFFYKLISRWFIALVQVNSATQTIAEVLFLPAVLCPFTTADYLYITATSPLSRPALVSQCDHCLQGSSSRGDLSRMWRLKVSLFVFFVFFLFERSQIHFWPARAQQRKVATAQKANGLQHLRSPFRWVVETLLWLLPRFPAEGGIWALPLSQKETEKIKPLAKVYHLHHFCSLKAREVARKLSSGITQSHPAASVVCAWRLHRYHTDREEPRHMSLSQGQLWKLFFSVARGKWHSKGSVSRLLLPGILCSGVLMLERTHRGTEWSCVQEALQVAR